MRTEAMFPREWADIQNNLGGACGLLGDVTGDREWYLEAASHFAAELRVHTQGAYPRQYEFAVANLRVCEEKMQGTQ